VQAKSSYADIQKQVWADAPWAFLGVDRVISGRQSNINGIKVLPDGSINILNAEVK
jgi:glutathione transport system substrate-binding protein